MGLAVLAVPRLGNVLLRLHFLRRGTSGSGIGILPGAVMFITGFISTGLGTGKAITAAKGGNTDQIPGGLVESVGMAGDGLYEGATGEKQETGRLIGSWGDFGLGLLLGKYSAKLPTSKQLGPVIQTASYGNDVYTGISNSIKTYDALKGPPPTLTGKPSPAVTPPAVTSPTVTPPAVTSPTVTPPAVTSPTVTPPTQ